VRVLIVDDHKFFRRVLCDLVSATPGFMVVGEAACGEDAMPATESLAAEYVLMDIRMPGCGGIEAARLLTQRHPGLVVLLISAQEPPSFGASEFSDEAVSFVSKRDLCGAVLRRVWESRAASG
jgi:DNA-binding NarL/FixJ family response regulator